MGAMPCTAADMSGVIPVFKSCRDESREKYSLRVDKLYMYEDERVWLAASMYARTGCRRWLAACRPCPTTC